LRFKRAFYPEKIVKESIKGVKVIKEEKVGDYLIFEIEGTEEIAWKIYEKVLEEVMEART